MKRLLLVATLAAGAIGIDYYRRHREDIDELVFAIVLYLLDPNP